jgi:hypothetical protein
MTYFTDTVTTSTTLDPQIFSVTSMSDTASTLSSIPSQIQPFNIPNIHTPLSNVHFNVDFFYTVGRVGVTIFEMIRRTDTWPLLIVVLILIAAFNVLFSWLNKTDELE